MQYTEHRHGDCTALHPVLLHHADASPLLGPDIHLKTEVAGEGGVGMLLAGLAGGAAAASLAGVVALGLAAEDVPAMAQGGAVCLRSRHI